MKKENVDNQSISNRTEITTLAKNLELISGGLVSQISPLILQLNTIQDIIKPKAIEIFSAINEFNKIMHEPMLMITNLAFDAVKNIENSIGPLSTLAARIDYALKAIDEKSKLLIEKCIEDGWYPLPEFGISFCPDSENFEDAMASAVEEVLPEIEIRLCNNYPSRAYIIRSAFAAHRREEYMLAIPCLFSQADGICYELTGVQPFTNKDGSRLKDKLSSYDQETTGSRYFRPLFDIEEIRKKTTEISPEKLNRHASLHGTSTSCYTKNNSLKLISFLGNLDWLLDDFRKNEHSAKV